MEFTLSKSQRLTTKAAAKDNCRPVLACVHIRKGVIEATDGFMLIQKPVQYTGEETVLLPAKGISKCKGDIVTFSSEDKKEFTAQGEIVTIIQAQEGSYPQLDQLVPMGEAKFKIALDRKLLIQLLQAFDENTVKFYFYGVALPVKVKTAKEGELGIIMPMLADLEE